MLGYMLSASDLAAWWGAVVATCVFAWELYKWRSARPQLLIRPQQSWSSEGGKFLIEVANIGNEATSLTDVYVKPGVGIKETLGSEPKWIPGGARYIASTHERFALPYKLEPSSVWQGWVTPSEIEWINDVETIVVKVVDAHGKKSRQESTLASFSRSA